MKLNLEIIKSRLKTLSGIFIDPDVSSGEITPTPIVGFFYIIQQLVWG